MKYVFILWSISLFSYAAVDQTPHIYEVCEPPHPSDSVGIKRAKYVCEIETYLPLVESALIETNTPHNQQAQVLNQLRRDIGKKYKDLTPKWLRGMIYCRNQQIYQDPLGPTYDYLTSKKGKKDVEIIASASRTGGKDLWLNHKWVMALMDYADKAYLGPAIYTGWSWIPGESCPEIE